MSRSPLIDAPPSQRAPTATRRTRARRPRRAGRAPAPSPCRLRAASASAPVASCAEHDHLLGVELDRAHRVRHERIGRDVRLGRRVVVRRPRPQPSRRATARPARAPRPARAGCPTPRSRSARSTSPTRRRARPAAAARPRRIVNQPSAAGTRCLLTTALPVASTSASASAMMRAISSATVGRSSITPATCPLDSTPRVEAALDEPGPQQHRRVGGEHDLRPLQVALALHRAALVEHPAPRRARHLLERDRVAQRARAAT